MPAVSEAGQENENRSDSLSLSPIRLLTPNCPTDWRPVYIFGQTQLSANSDGCLVLASWTCIYGAKPTTARSIAAPGAGMAISPVVAAPNPGEAVAVDTVPDGETNQASLPAASLVVPQAGAASGEDGNNKEPLSDLALVDILVRWINNKDDVPPFVHHLDLYARPPWEAVQGRKHALRATRHGGGEETWFVVSEDGNRRGRKVGEAGTWHVEGSAKPILGADGRSVANKKRFSYKMGAAPGKSGKQESTGWITMQIALEGAHQNPHKVISMVYKSSHAKTWTAASSYAGAEEEYLASADAPVPAAEAVSKARGARFRPRARATAAQKGKAALAVPEVSRDGEKADATQLSLTRGIAIDLLLQAARKAEHCVHYKEALQIKEFESAKLIYHTSMTELGLDSTILSGSFIQLDLLIQHVAMTKELTPNGRNHLVCLAERMSGTIFSEYLKELPARGSQASNALERLGIDVQEALQMPSKGMKISPLVIPEGDAKGFALELLLSAAALVAAAGNKRPISGSFTAASSSGVKRLRQERTETPPIATVEEAHPVGGDKAEDYTEIFAADMLNGIEITPIGGGGHCQESNDALERTGVDAQQVSQRASKHLPLAVQDIGSEAEAEHCAVEAVELNECYRNMDDITEIESDDGDKFPVGAPQGDRYTMPVGIPAGGEPAGCMPFDAAGVASLVGVDQVYSAGFPDMPLDLADYGYLEQQGAEAEMVEAGSGPCHFLEDPLALKYSAHRPLFDNSTRDSMTGLVADEVDDSMPVDGFDDGGTYADFLNLDQDDHTEAEAEQQVPESEVVTGLAADEFNHGGLFDLGFLNQLQDEHNDGVIDHYFNLPQDDHTEAEAGSRLAGIW